MTLSIAILTAEQAIVATDRRISANGKIVDEEFDKTAVVFLRTARLALSFTGLAVAGTFNTHEWILESSPELGYPSFNASEFVNNLTDALTEEWKTNPQINQLSRASKRLSILLCGFETLPPFKGIFAIITNWQDPHTNEDSAEAREEFQLFTGTKKPEPACMPIVVGVPRGIDPSNFSRMCDDAPKRNIRTITNRLVRVVQQAALNAHSANTIGRQITTIRIPADPTEPIQTDYHVGTPTRGSALPAAIWSLPDQQYSLSNLSITPVKKSTPDISIPGVARNKRCPCGSGLKYKSCHGKTAKRRNRKMPHPIVRSTKND